MRKDQEVQRQRPCTLCGNKGSARPADFHTLYSQSGGQAVILPWYECDRCQACFVYPVPSVESIQSYWRTVIWASGDSAENIAAQKRECHNKLLALCRGNGVFGRLLDFGSNFGVFLNLAKGAGWDPIGFEPNEQAAAIAREEGFDVRSEWSLRAAGFSDCSFRAIVANDTFYYVWEPFETLRIFYGLLAPGGHLAMRIANKREWLDLALSCSVGKRRLEWTTRMMRGEFHTISVKSLKVILQNIGYANVRVHSRARTAPLNQAGIVSGLGYLAADVVSVLSFGRINVSPGVYVSAEKPLGG